MKGIALSQLTHRIVTPALDTPVVEQGTDMLVAGSDLGGVATRTQIGNGDGSTGFIISHVITGLMAELAKIVAAVADDLIIIEDDAGESTTGGHLFG